MPLSQQDERSTSRVREDLISSEHGAENCKERLTSGRGSISSIGSSKAAGQHEDSDLDELFSPLHNQFSSFSECDDENDEDFEFLNTSYPKRFNRQVYWDDETLMGDSRKTSNNNGGSAESQLYTVSESTWEPIFNVDDMVVSENKDFWKNIETTSTTEEQLLPFSNDAWPWNQQSVLNTTSTPSIHTVADSLEDFINSSIVGDSNVPLSSDSFQYKIKKLSFRDSEGKLSLDASNGSQRNCLNRRRIEKKAIRRKSAVREMFCPGVGIGEFMLL
ncbi:uncharacterized protein Ecym_5443 [Eremothecium cymbalariae DBVPG|uniref:Uncharacterized protein n=1 Tax=Eremothecium cymbalariae (strain CBS 270.75 / DBVPG 7215 / KCTC 17166 / NRRL Y-17582) TaxID=931890 RepID=I6NDQ2_ERECY|nr:hypothetical protein Ecym_5443 [Eremothecium cymbalariae DBVPG\